MQTFIDEKTLLTTAVIVNKNPTIFFETHKSGKIRYPSSVRFEVWDEEGIFGGIKIASCGMSVSEFLSGRAVSCRTEISRLGVAGVWTPEYEYRPIL